MVNAPEPHFYEATQPYKGCKRCGIGPGALHHNDHEVRRYQKEQAMVTTLNPNPSPLMASVNAKVVIKYVNGIEVEYQLSKLGAVLIGPDEQVWVGQVRKADIERPEPATVVNPKTGAIEHVMSRRVDTMTAEVVLTPLEKPSYRSGTLTQEDVNNAWNTPVVNVPLDAPLPSKTDMKIMCRCGHRFGEHMSLKPHRCAQSPCTCTEFNPPIDTSPDCCVTCGHPEKEHLPHREWSRARCNTLGCACPKYNPRADYKPDNNVLRERKDEAEW